jgi:nucleoside-triphosphatase THEP1
VSLLSLVSQGNRCITIRGRPGIGKTAMASRVCQYCVSGGMVVVMVGH